MKKREKATLILVPIFPMIIKIVYLPIDVFVTVKVLSCGYGDGFNANDFNNKVIMPFVLLFSLIMLLIYSQKLSGWKKMVYLLFGGLVQIFLSICWGMFIWM